MRYCSTDQKLAVTILLFSERSRSDRARALARADKGVRGKGRTSREAGLDTGALGGKLGDVCDVPNLAINFVFLSWLEDTNKQFRWRLPQHREGFAPFVPTLI